MSLLSLRTFLRNRDGNIAVLFGISAVPLVLFVGMAIDYGHAFLVRERMATALDAAALSVAGFSGLSKKQAEEKMKAYFDANYPETQRDEVTSVQMTDTGTSLVASADAVVPTLFMKLGGINVVPVRAETEVTKDQTKLEIVLALDNTGSMRDGGKLNALKTAAGSLVDILFEGQQTSNKVDIALVPFSAAVNVGPDKVNSGWIDTDAESAVASEDFSPGVNPLKLYAGMRNQSWSGCVRERAAPYDVSDTPPSKSDPETLFAPYFAPDEPDITPRGYYPNNYGNDGDFGGSSGDVVKRQRFAGKYAGMRVSKNSDRGPAANCPVQAITPLTNQKSTIDRALGKMVATGNTVVPEGLVWGWRVLSPGAPYTEGKPYNAKQNTKAIILLTDGANDVSSKRIDNHNGAIYSAFGYPTSGHLGSKDGNDAERSLDAKAEAICNNMKDPNVNIKIYTIGFQVSNPTINTLLRDCASGPDMYFNSPSNDQLQDIFKGIARELGKLRISR